MESLYLLIPLSVVLLLLIVGVFAWALFGEQFEDMDREGMRIFFDESPTAMSSLADNAGSLHAHPRLEN